MKCLSGAFVFNTVYSASFKFQTTSVYGVVIDKRKLKRNGISKLEGPVTYSTRSEFKVIGSSESQLKFDSDIT
jgi:hypothetical protein